MDGVVTEIETCNCGLLCHCKDAVEIDVLPQNVGKVIAKVVQVVEGYCLRQCDKPEFNTFRCFFLESSISTRNRLSRGAE